MPKPIPAWQIKDLRHQLATTLAVTSANILPQFCRRFGLAEGDRDEAMKSKYNYVARRLAPLKIDQVLTAARTYLEEEASFPLSEIVAKIDERDQPPVTELTRRRIISIFGRRSLTTEIEPIELLRRLWPIAQLLSIYPSGTTLEDDIYQHTIRNDDWSNAELLDAVGLLTCSQAQLFRFLAQVVGPLAQTPVNQTALVGEINDVLQHDGYRLSVIGKLSGTPVYAVTAARLGSPADAGISAALKAFNPDEVHARWSAAVDRQQTDPRGAITLARTLLEDVCKWVLDEAGNTYGDKDDLPTLYRKLAKLLKLAPDDYTEETFRKLLGSCQQIVESLGSLRSKLGDAHSAGPNRSRPQPRHAELAVNLSGTMATFLVSTWQARKVAESVEKAVG